VAHIFTGKSLTVNAGERLARAESPERCSTSETLAPAFLLHHLQ